MGYGISQLSGILTVCRILHCDFDKLGGTLTIPDDGLRHELVGGVHVVSAATGSTGDPCTDLVGRMDEVLAWLEKDGVPVEEG